jgi:hypothetical protein
MKGRNSPSENPHPASLGIMHPRARYRGAFRLGFGISAVVHILAISLYPSFFSGIPEADVRFGGYAQPLSPPGTELVNIVELPDDPDPDAPPPPEEEPEPEVPTVPAEALPTGIPGVVGPEEFMEATPGPTAAERIRPKGEDLRFWAPVDPERTALTREELMRLQLIAEIEAMNDSAAIVAELERRAREWTYTDEDGKKWGVSPGKIHLGDVTLPMPFGFGMSPGQRERAEDRLWAWDEIEEAATRGEFLRTWRERDAAIRARKNAERRPDTTRTGGGGSSPTP